MLSPAEPVKSAFAKGSICDRPKFAVVIKKVGLLISASEKNAAHRLILAEEAILSRAVYRAEIAKNGHYSRISPGIAQARMELPTLLF